MRSRLSLLVTQPVVSPTWPTTSLIEAPELIGQAMCTVVQAASGESLDHWTSVGVIAVEADELRSLPFVDPAVAECPACPAVPLPLPVDDPFAERASRVGVERDCPARLIAEAQRPAFLVQVRQEFFVVAALRSES
jgi:hypothetical protein